MNEKNSTTGIKKAIAVAGGVRPLARLTGIGKSQISLFNQRGWVAPERCLLIHSKTSVPLHDLNPKIYPEV